MALNNSFVGSITISDEIKEDSIETIDYLNSINAKTIMLTGDNDIIAKDVFEKLNLTLDPDHPEKDTRKAGPSPVQDAA